YGNQGCAGVPDEDTIDAGTTSTLPQNTTFAATSVGGSGKVKFILATDETNVDLGCSATTTCSLVAIPIMGISCDPTGASKRLGQSLPAAYLPPAAEAESAADNCETSGSFQPGQPQQSTSGALAVSGALWWSASNWNNRIVVPLSFTAGSSVCSVTGSGAPVQLYGSEIMAEATDQWTPAFCQNPKLFNLSHVQLSEPSARSLLTVGSVNAAMGTNPGQFFNPTVQAPVAIGGFAISYTIDDSSGQPYEHLQLDARLLAKLLTESYTEDSNYVVPYMKESVKYRSMAANPLNITNDPEFIALNPGLPHIGTGVPGPATLIALSELSDVTYALTSYINADPEARAFLNGKPDPWGMVVNPSYRNISLPVNQWPLLDTFIQPQYNTYNQPCITQSPTPYMQLIANPALTLASSELAVQYAHSTAKLNCTPGNPSDPGSIHLWAQYPADKVGQRFILGVTSLGEANRYDLDTAALQTTSYVPDATNQFPDPGGRIFVAPTADSMKNAADAMVLDSGSGTWQMPYGSLPVGAYPGTMPVYADIPTSGLSASDAKDYAEFLRFAAGPGQISGSGNGQLPGGYLPMTAANGLGDMVSATLADANAVATQNGTPKTAASSQAQSGGGAGSNPNDSGGSSGPSSGASTPAAASSSPSTRSPSGSGTALPSPSTSPVAAFGKTPGMFSGLSGVLIPVILGGGLLAGLLAAGLYVAPRVPKRVR
ncbi:MAG TPA: hypothetical protein VGC09_06610, partial [Rhodopila sp.]